VKVAAADQEAKAGLSSTHPFIRSFQCLQSRLALVEYLFATPLAGVGDSLANNCWVITRWPILRLDREKL